MTKDSTELSKPIQYIIVNNIMYPIVVTIVELSTSLSYPKA